MKLIITQLKTKFTNAEFVTNLLVALMLLLAGLESMNAQCPTPPGDPAVYGSGSWIGYVYSGLDANNPPQNAFISTPYQGYITQPEQFNMNLVNAAVSGANVCGSYADSFALRFKMHKTFAAGYYTITIGGDDGDRLSLDGGNTWAMTDWNYHAYQTRTATFFLSGDYDLVLENYDQGGQSQVSFAYTFCGVYSTPPTSITGANTVCAGTSTTLTAQGATLASGSYYQWGTGNTIGNNIIAGNTQSISVTPTANTTYWVRVIDPTCNGQTAGVNYAVTYTAVSTPPTSIVGNTTLCAGTSTTLTAIGGNLLAGSAYEWGTGTVGSNIIAGETLASITVTPSANITYWVRKTNSAPCGPSAAATVSVTVNAISGDQTSYGNNSWIGYVYATIGTANPPADAFTVPYKGYVTEPETFFQDWGSAGPSGANLCGSYSDRFAIRFKMTKNFTPGYYTFTAGGDDGYRLSLDGGSTWILNNWTDHGYATSTTATLFMSGNTNLVLEYYEQGGLSQVSFNYTSCTDYSSAPTAISGNTTACQNVATTLTATGGYAAPGSYYQWGTGTTIGNNIIVGQTGASISLSLGSTNTVWVRRIDPAPCNLTSSGISQVITIINPSTAPTGISGTNNICAGNSTVLTATGGSGSIGSIYEWGTGTTVGLNPIAGETAVNITVTPIATTSYWVRRVDSAPCNTTSAGFTRTVTINALSTAPTSINSAATVCSPVGGITLNAIGGTSATGSTYQWGTGSVIGTSPIGGQTNSSYYVNPTAVTTYWVRRYDPAPCNSYTTGTTIMVYPVSTAPTTISGTNTICNGGSTTLTASGGTTSAIGSFEWGTGGTVGTNPISGATSASITVSPITNTTYWVRRADASPCSSTTSGTTYNVTVNQLSTAPTSINSASSVCSPVGGITLNAIGGTSATGSTYQWGTGSVIGTSPIAGQTNNSYYVNPTAVTTYWVRRYDPAPCNTYTGGVTIVVYPASTAPTTISGTNLTCSGQTITLTASGGTLGALGRYEWGTGSAGSNIITGQTAASISVSPAVSTTYWVRRLDSTPCTTVTGSTSFTVTVNQRSVAPTSISGPSSLCFTAGGGTLTAVGGTPGTNSTYQWGTGTVGSNIQSSTVSTMYINPSVNTTYWVRLIDPAPCNNTSAAVTFTVSVNTTSTNVTAISGATTICNGSSTTLTATGGSLGIGAAYQWGTGTTLGDNPIAGATSASIAVNPSATTTYWVRRVDGAPCTTTTWGPNVTVTVNSQSTAPTSISGATSGCPGTSMTLTANGGTAASGSTYQWGTGTTIGSNIINGQTGASITVSPTATTTYWVRRYDSGCATYTTGVTTTATMVVPGDPTVFGANQWNVYGYSTGDITLANAIYAGFYTQTTLGFDTQTSWSNNLSPSSASNWSGCVVPADNFTMVHKRRGFSCGSYTLVLSNWDDATEVYLNGSLIWNCTSWSGANVCNGNIGTYSLTSTSTIEVRTRENTGVANVALAITNVTVTSTAPTLLTSTSNSVCAGSAVTLTASGGTVGSNGIFQWGTGTVGLNIIAGETNSSIIVSPSTTTTYWVRRINSVCGQTTAPLTKSITVNAFAVAGNLSCERTVICRNTAPSSIALTGYSGTIVKWQYASNAAFTVGVTDINVTTPMLASNNMGTFASTRYFRAVVQSCDIVYTTPIEITVPTAVQYTNAGWSATPTENTPVIINSNLTLTSNLNVCACQVKNGVTLTINPNQNLIVQTTLEVEPTGNLVIEDKGSLVQVDDSATDVGSIKVKRDSQPMKTYDYTYWSAPVQGNTLAQLSPATLADKYYRFDPMINNWVSIAGGNAVMEAGKGYIVRAPQGWNLTNSTSGIYKAQFSGVPNNGVILTAIQRGTVGLSNLIGNPYPSAIDIDLFLTDPANSSAVFGTIYLWTHNTAISGSIPGNWLYNYTADDYAKYNLTGGVRSANPAITGGLIPDGKVASGQSFFIEANSAQAVGSYSATFRNSMRVAGHNDHFYRNGNTISDSNTTQPQLQKHRLWVDITNTNGAYNEALVGYIGGATNGFDPLFDGKTMAAGNVLSLYSLAGSDQYSIQGKALPFQDSDVIPMGYKTTIAGNFTLSLAQFDGLFTGQNVYLEDHLLNITHDLKSGDYNFTSAIGTFNDRFEIKFINETLATTAANFEANNVLIVANDKQVAVRSTVMIADVIVFDLLGRKIFSASKVNALQFHSPILTSSEQVFIVKVKLEGGLEVAQKVIMQ